MRTDDDIPALDLGKAIAPIADEVVKIGELATRSIVCVLIRRQPAQKEWPIVLQSEFIQQQAPSPRDVLQDAGDHVVAQTSYGDELVRRYTGRTVVAMHRLAFDRDGIGVPAVEEPRVRRREAEQLDRDRLCVGRA